MKVMKETYVGGKGIRIVTEHLGCALNNALKKEHDYFISSNRIADFFPKVITVEKTLKIQKF